VSANAGKLSGAREAIRVLKSAIATALAVSNSPVSWTDY
jgi:hypothetical protein